MAKRRGHLYRSGGKTRAKRAFERRYERRGYSKARADRIYGATVGNVRREQAAMRGGRVRERVRGHYATRNGRRYRVRAHIAVVHAERHARGHHRGRCGPSCRAGRSTHYHASRRTRRRR
ncbi:MAG TPA: hypothetical protein VFF67_10270 [Thermoplasmata archaeon]|nr:hypothetical protein [Thermoplasmata archaeon]